MKVELRNIHKRFGHVHANNDITLTVEAGTIHALVGENGAGKSTLMKVLSGFISADTGDVILDGLVANPKSPSDAIGHGVGMLHQDPLDFPPMRLLENFMTGLDKKIRLPSASAETDFRDLCRQFDFDLDPHAFVYDITVGERQQLEIIRLLWLGVRTLILDEPTTGISAPQKVKLFATLRKLAADGKSIILVTHKLEDVDELCSKASVLRRGVLVGELPVPVDGDALIQMMFGTIIKMERRPDADLGRDLLQLQTLTISDLRMSMPDVNLTVREGEVIGVAGLEGSGQHLLMQVCAGLIRSKKGKVVIDGNNLTHQPYPRFSEAGVAFMPADRLEEGLVTGLTIAEHTVLAHRLANRGQKQSLFIDWDTANKESRHEIDDYKILGRPDSTVESLSGGNQQRTLLALLPPQLRLLIMEHPTRGLDVESALYIWGKLLNRRHQGTAIIFSSADLDEIFQYSDRILVCYGGKILAELNTTDTSVEALGYLIGGRTPPTN